MEYPVRVAWCPIFHAANGGTFDELGRPMGEGILGKCSRAFDCIECRYLQQWIEAKQHEGWSIGWECDRCLKDTMRADRQVGERFLPAIYTAGRKPVSEDDPDYDQDHPRLPGCTHCDWETSFLQLVLRRPR